MTAPFPGIHAAEMVLPCPELPATLTPGAIIAGFPYIWSLLARDGTGIIVDRGERGAKLAVVDHAPSLEVTGLTAAIVRGALRESGAPQADVQIVAATALGDVRDVLVVTW